MTDDRTGHVFDEFPLLLTGQADRSTVFRVSTHLRECGDCKDELVDAVTAHATLASAAHHAPDIATGGWLNLPGRHADVPDLLATAAVESGSESLVDLGPVFEQIRLEAEAAEAADAAATATAPAVAPESPAGDGTVVPLASRRRGNAWRRGLAAAAAVVVLGGGGALAATELRSDGRTVTVGAYGAGTVDASAQVGDGWMTLDASKLPTLPSSQYYEVWLVDAARAGMLPLGSLGGDRTGKFSVPAAVMSRYDSVQVTVQQNGNPAPSSTSVLRASF